MIVVEVLQGGKRYVFTAKCKIGKGVHVLCDTRYGESPGVVKECFEVKDTDSDLYKRYLELMGAKEPLKEVIGVYVSFKWMMARLKDDRGR